MKVAAVLPAYNEEARVADVVRVVLRAPSVDEVIVVDDGSCDRTAQVVRSFPDVTLVELPRNVGKGGAMVAGVQATDADVIVFLDADLIGLRPEHVENLVAPVKYSRAKMAIGRFRGGRRLTDWAQKLTPCISGQRAIRRDVFEQIPNIESSRYGVEMAITRFCHHYRMSWVSVHIPGVTHPMKEEKLGFLRGAASRARMYAQICRMWMDPRPPKRQRPRHGFLRRWAATARLQGRGKAVPVWVYRQERALRRLQKTQKRRPRKL